MDLHIFLVVYNSYEGFQGIWKTHGLTTQLMQLQISGIDIECL